MPGKSRHGKKKRFRSSKKSKSLLRQETITPQAPVTATTPKPAATAPPTPAFKAAASPVSVKTDQYAYVPGDLRRIGSLSGIIIIILFILYYILS